MIKIINKSIGMLFKIIASFLLFVFAINFMIISVILIVLDSLTLYLEQNA